jgi:hypothetical protein
MLMKKALLIGVVFGLLCAWSIPAMAVDLSVNGFIGIAGQISKNAETVGPIPQWPLVNVIFNDQMASYVSSRSRLIFTLRASEDLFGVFGFKMDYHAWGAHTPGHGPGSWYAIVGGQVSGLEIQSVFIDFRVPPKLPIWLRVGMQPFFERGWVFGVFDAPGVTARINIDPIKLAINGYYFKVLDNNDGGFSAAYGGELYGLDAAIPISAGPVNIRPGMFFFYQNLRLSGLGLFPAGVWSDVDAIRTWWIGAFVDGKIGPVNAQVDFIYNGGQADLTAAAGGDSLDIASWLLRGELSYVFKKLTVGVSGMYVKGEDTTTEDKETFFLPGGDYGSECRPVLSDFMVFTDGWMGTSMWPGPGLIDYPGVYMPGFWDVRGFAYYQVVDWLKLGVNFGYIGDTVGGNGTFGPQDAIGNDGQDDGGIGWEMDFGTNIQIYKNLSLNSGFGYLFAQKALSQAGGVAPQDPWVFKSVLLYTF